MKKIDETKNLLIEKYLIISDDGKVNMTAKPPQLSGGQIAVKLNVVVPRKFFEPDWPEATLTVSDDMVRKPPVDIQLTHELSKI